MSGSNVCASFMLMEPLPVTASACVPSQSRRTGDRQIGIRSGDMSLGQMQRPRHAAMRATGPLPASAMPCRVTRELVNLRISAKLLWLAAADRQH